MIVRVNVIGSSIVYFKDNVWNIVFITDDCHVANFHDSNNPNPVPLGNGGIRTIDFVSPGADVAQRPQGNVVDQFFNLAALHGNSNGSNLTVVKSPKCGRGAIHMTIPFGTLIPGGKRTHEYFKRRVGAPSSPAPTGQFPVRDFTIQFKVKDPNGLFMNFSNPVDNRHYPLSNGVLVLTFYNHCEKELKYNDFIHVYDWVNDLENGWQFLAGTSTAIMTDPDPADPCPKPSIESESQITGIDGDCDPIFIEPPPV